MLGAAVARCSGSRRRPALTEGAVAAKTRHPRVDSGGLMRPWGKPRTSTSAAAGMAWSATRSLRTGWVGGGSGWSVAAGGLTDRGWGGPQRHGGRGRRSGAERRKRASLIRELTEGESGDAAWRRCFGDKASTVARKGRKANGRSTTTRLREPTPLGSGAAAARRKRFNVGVNVHDAAVPGRRATSSDAASVSPDVAVEDDDVDGAEAATPAWALGAAAGGMLGVAPERVQQVMRQALPVMGGMASQNVLNLADTVMVGRLGTACVAAVGISSTLNFQCQAALQGISSGVQAMSARRIGEERRDVAAVPLNAALVMCLLFGVPMAVAGIIYAPAVVPKLTADPAVIAASIPYLQARLCAVPAVGINFAFRGFWNAVQRPHVYMNTLLVMHAVNITLSLLLIFGCPSVGVPAMGVVGAGVGTAVSVWVGTALYLWRGFCEAREMGFACEAPKPSDVKTLAMQAVPTSITNLLFATGMTTLYWIVGHLGTAEVAAVNVLINLMLTLVLPCMGMGLAAGALSVRKLRTPPSLSRQENAPFPFLCFPSLPFLSFRYPSHRRLT